MQLLCYVTSAHSTTATAAVSLLLPTTEYNTFILVLICCLLVQNLNCAQPSLCIWCSKSLMSPAMGHWGTCLPLDVYQVNFFQYTLSSTKGLSLWLSGLMRFLSRSALLGLTGWRPPTTWVQSPVEAWVSLLVGLIVGMHEINFSDRHRGSACVLYKL